MNNYKNWLKILLPTLLIIGALAVFLYIRANQNQTTTDPNTNDLPERTINYSPPTEDEKAAGDKQKDETIQQENRSIPNTAQVVIVDAGQYGNIIEVRAFVSNVIANGTCTVTFTKGGSKVIKTVPARADASSTPCVNVEVPRSEFAQTGTWEVTVLFESEKAKGSSSSKLEIQ